MTLAVDRAVKPQQKILNENVILIRPLSNQLAVILIRPLSNQLALLMIDVGVLGRILKV